MTVDAKFVHFDKAAHDRKKFDCGQKTLNDFLRSKADEHKKYGLSQTMVLPAVPATPSSLAPIKAFYTIAPSTIERETLPRNQAKKLPSYPIPVFLIPCLAVASSHQGDGLGKITTIKALERLNQVNISAYAVVIEPLDDRAENIYRKFGFEPLKSDLNRLYLPMGTVRKLFA